MAEADLNLRQRQTVRYMINQEALTLAALDTQLIDSAMIASLSATKITSGTITAQTITIGTGGTIRSADFVAGVSGWSIFGDGSAEFGNVTVRGVYKSAATGRRIEIRPDADLGADGTGAAVDMFTGNAGEGYPPIFYGLWDTTDNMPCVRFISGHGNHLDDEVTKVSAFGDNRGAATPQYGVVTVRASAGLYAQTWPGKAANQALRIDQTDATRDIAWFWNSGTNKIIWFTKEGRITMPFGGRIQFGANLEYLEHDNTVSAERLSLMANGGWRLSVYRSGKVDVQFQDFAVGTNAATGTNARGLNLPGAVGPLVSRAYAAFTSGKFLGAGRYGLFQEGTAAIDLGIENVAGAHWGVNKYNADSTIGRRIVDGVPDQATRYGPTHATLDVAEAVGGGGFAESRTESHNGAAFRQHVASNHFNTSDERLKTNVHIPEHADHLAPVLAAQVHHWEDERGREQCGPMARDLPEVCVSKTRLTPHHYEGDELVWDEPTEDVLLVSTTSMIGMLWGAVQELAARIPSGPS